MESFSYRFEVREASTRPPVREMVPEGLRSLIINFLRNELKFSNTYIRDLVSAGIGLIPDYTHHWGDQNIWQESAQMIRDAKWYQVLDTAELIYRELDAHHPGSAQPYQRLVNHLLISDNIAWKMKDGLFVADGNEIDGQLLEGSLALVNDSGLTVASSELKQAIRCISERPDANLSGALHHTMCALESVAREVAGDRKATLGEILSKYPGLLPKPLDEAASKLWGYSSNNARHGLESRDLSYDSVRLVVCVAASITAFLASKCDTAGNLNP